jgi:hypothetical protein
MNQLLFTITCLLWALPSFSQLPRKCGTVNIHRQLLQRDPSVAARKQALERATESWTANRPNGFENRTVITIPVVVHVVYRTTTQNISDAQIQSQIDVLNKDYRKLNADASNVPNVWKPLAADVQIQFCLASRTPSGAATNGITRTVTTATSFVDNPNTPDIFEEDRVKSDATGGKTGWNPQKYLNIWVCRLDGSTLGYAYFPSDIVTTPELDGAVIDYRCFGTLGTAGTNGFTGYNLGRTTSHEIGHYFNLSHPWGDDLIDGTACESDNVSDTPSCFSEATGCETFPFNIGTNCVTDANGQMFMNYMDYSDDNCLTLFTAGQAARMQAALNIDRAGLITSNGCVVPVPVELISFEGKTDSKINHLFWATASELSNDYFEIERSFDGHFFQKIARIKGHGTTQERQNYTFDDGTFNGITAYYRLNQIDFDGKSTLSNVVSLQNGKTSTVRIFPNPVGTEGVLVQVEGDGKKEIWLQDVAGKTLFHTISNEKDIPISTAQLASGLYFITVKTASGVFDSQKLVVR